MKKQQNKNRVENTFFRLLRISQINFKMENNLKSYISKYPTSSSSFAFWMSSDFEKQFNLYLILSI